jgi:quinol monooxygenase YgiN
MVILVVTYVVKEGREAAFEERMREMVRLTRQEPGCLTYIPQRSREHPRTYLLYERYVDQAAMDAHRDSDYFKRYVLGEYNDLLESRSSVYYTPLVED